MAQDIYILPKYFLLACAARTFRIVPAAGEFSFKFQLSQFQLFGSIANHAFAASGRTSSR
jgi:hypothetical protein